MARYIPNLALPLLTEVGERDEPLVDMPEHWPGLVFLASTLSIPSVPEGTLSSL